MRDFIELITIYLLTLTIVVLSLSLLVVTLDSVYPLAIEPLMNYIAELLEPNLESPTYVTDI